jgi:hypothetical protein
VISIGSGRNPPAVSGAGDKTAHMCLAAPSHTGVGRGHRIAFAPGPYRHRRCRSPRYQATLPRRRPATQTRRGPYPPHRPKGTYMVVRSASTASCHVLPFTARRSCRTSGHAQSRSRRWPPCRG